MDSVNRQTDKRILVILPNNLGDVIMTTPVLEGLRARYPAAAISFLVEEGFEAGLIDNPHIDTILTIPRKGIKARLITETWNTALQELDDFIGELNRNPYSMVLNLSQHLYLSYLASLMQSEMFTGSHFLREGNHAIGDSWSQYLYAIPFARRYNALHVTDVYRRIASVDKHRGGYTITLSRHEKDEATRYLTAKGIDLNKRVAIAVFQPGAAVAAKRWPASHFISLGKLLLAEGWQILISGAEQEMSLASEIHRALDRKPVLTAGETSFRQALCNCSFARACITGDTALMHAAAGLNIPVFGLFGATSPVETGPYGEGHFIFSAQCSRRPCFGDECKTMLCMKAIEPEDVFSCIRQGEAPRNPRCDIYKTSCNADGDYRIIPLCSNTDTYYSESGSALVLQGFSPGTMLYTQDESQVADCYREAKRMLGICAEMRMLLSGFLDTGDNRAITLFEKKKTDLQELGGIAQFWNALLNIRFNSIAIVNPLSAIGKHIDALDKTRRQIVQSFALSPIPYHDL
jgi:heptosyltransferase-2